MDADQKFAKVVAAFAGNDRVTHGGGAGFGSGALKTDGKIFAMVSSKGVFVVKPPKARVDALVAKGAGERFDPGHGRVMKEWLAVSSLKENWAALAREALDFVQTGKR